MTSDKERIYSAEKSKARNERLFLLVKGITIA